MGSSLRQFRAQNSGRILMEEVARQARNKWRERYNVGHRDDDDDDDGDDDDDDDGQIPSSTTASIPLSLQHFGPAFEPLKGVTI